MTIKYTLNHDIDAVINLLTDPDYLVARSIACGELSADAEVEETDTKTLIRMNREVVRDLPKVLAKVFDAKQMLRMEESWQQVGDTYVGKSEFTVDGQPASLTADSTIKPTADGCEYTITVKAKARIPLIGGTVEKYILANAKDTIPHEIAFLKEKLAG